MPLLIIIKLITFANSLDSDQTRQNIGPDSDPNWHAKLPSMQSVKKVWIAYQEEMLGLVHPLDQRSEHELHNTC